MNAITTNSIRFRLCAIYLALSTIAITSNAQNYPSRSIRLIVPFSPGGGTDTLSRILAPKLNESLGQSVIIENHPGASGQIGTDIIARAKPDGYTIGFIDTSLTSNPSLYRKLPYDTEKDFSGISLLASAPVILIVHPSLPVITLSEFITFAKARPGQLNFATGGTGSATHLGVELFKSVTGIQLVHIPYKGSGPAAAAILGGQVVMTFASPSATSAHITRGRLRALAITAQKRIPALPNIATFTELGLHGVDSGTHWVSIAPVATNKDINNILSQQINKILQIPDIQTKLINLGFNSIGSTPEECTTHIRLEIKKWTDVVKRAKIVID